MSLSLMRFVCLGGLSAALLMNVNAVRADNAASSAKQPVTQAVLHLKFIKPSSLVSALVPRATNASLLDAEDKNADSGAVEPSLIPSGLVALSPDDVTGDLTVRGDKAALDQIAEIARLLDIKPRIVRLNVEIVRYLPGNGGAAPARRAVEATALLQTNQNALCETTVFGAGRAFRIRIAPHVNGDGSVTLTAEMSQNVREGKESRTSLRTEKIRQTRRLKDGETKTLLALGLTGSAANVAERMSQIREGAIPAPGASLEETFYLEVTPTVTSSPEK